MSLSTRINGTLITLDRISGTGIPVVSIGDYSRTQFPGGIISKYDRDKVAYREFVRAQQTMIDDAYYDGKCTHLTGEHNFNNRAVCINCDADQDIEVCETAIYATYADYVEAICSDCGDSH